MVSRTTLARFPRPVKGSPNVRTGSAGGAPYGLFEKRLIGNYYPRLLYPVLEEFEQTMNCLNQDFLAPTGGNINGLQKKFAHSSAAH